MAASTASRVAESLINLSHANKQHITNLKLQKLLYYAQAWHLALFDEIMFPESIEAWVHGPVVPCVFRQYKEYRWNPINPTQNGPSEEHYDQHLEEVWKVYGKFDAATLERLTHSEPPWKDAREGLPSDAPSHNVITCRAMRDYYSSVLNG
jgi:uncharacterized phage-associated protein